MWEAPGLAGASTDAMVAKFVCLSRCGTDHIWPQASKCRLGLNKHQDSCTEYHQTRQDSMLSVNSIQSACTSMLTFHTATACQLFTCWQHKASIVHFGTRLSASHSTSHMVTICPRLRKVTAYKRRCWSRACIKRIRYSINRPDRIYVSVCHACTAIRKSEEPGRDIRSICGMGLHCPHALQPLIPNLHRMKLDAQVSDEAASPLMF